MTDLLARLFVRDYQNTKDPGVRAAYGTMGSIVAIVCNTVLAIGKMAVGLLLGSIAILADGINNLSDAGSSVVSLVSFRIAAKPADRDHPFGHARIEYVASMIVSFLILLVGVELFTSSLEKIFHPTESDHTYFIPSIIMLSASILVKLWMGLFNFTLAKRIDSSVMRATGTDCLSDCVSTAAILVSTVLAATLGWHFLDGYIGILVACLILVAGCRILIDTKNSILGEKPVEETVRGIESIVGSYEGALGIHDMMVHSYGPGHTLASLHVEVDGARDVYETHDMIDNIERHINRELGIICTIHMDPIVVGDPEVDRLRAVAAAAVFRVDERLKMHDFRYVRGTTHHNLIFDIAVPFECTTADSDLCAAIDAAIKETDPAYCTVITVDRQ